MKKITTKIMNLNKLLVFICFLFIGIGASNDLKACICSVPNNVTATAGSSATTTGFTANWNAGTTGCGTITDYQIDVSTSPIFAGSVSGFPQLIGGAGTSKALTGLACNTTYYYRVKAFQACGSAYSVAWSGTISMTTAPCPSGPCFDGVQNNGETGVDCGGPCALACPTCFDGIQNGSETGVDCGGSCSLSCVVPPPTVSTATCPVVVNSPVRPINCDQVGTSMYELSGGLVTMASSGAGMPTPAPSCGAGSNGTWARYDLQGATSIMISWDQTLAASIGSGNSTTYATIYQGSTCGSLTEVSCGPAIDFTMGSYLVYNVAAVGLDPTKDVFVYFYNSAGNAYSFIYDVVGAATNPTNDACGGAISSQDGCNLGSIGDSWTPPTTGGATCSGGGTWNSNDNTVWYTVTATNTTGSIDIANTICNDGASGSAQFAVFTSCACAGNYTAGCFKGCATGTGTISLTGLTVGTTYYVAVDGTSGNMCKWDFVATGLLLPATYIDFEGIKKGNNVELTWSTTSEQNAHYYLVERSIDGENFVPQGTVNAIGNSSNVSNYSYIDDNAGTVTNYYRLKEYDNNGDFAYSKIISVDMSQSSKEPELYYDAASSSLVTVLDTKDGDPYTMNIYNTLGQLISTKNFSGGDSNTIPTDMRSANNGIYIVSLVDNITLKSYTMKFAR